MADHNQRAPQLIDVVRNQLTKMEPEFAKLLPTHIPPPRFVRTIMTALQADTRMKLLTADRKSLFAACVQCAQDGLLPDGREAALVPYSLEDEDSGNRALFVQYIPMIAGVRKKVRQSGELASWEARIARANDEFEVFFGDDERIVHKPNLADGGNIIAVYSIAVFKDGFKSRDVMTIAEVEAIRKKSRAKRGPWNDPTFYPEMVKKTMLKRHAKALPLSAELDLLLRRDDEMYDLTPHAEAASEKPAARERQKRPTLHDLGKTRTVEHDEQEALPAPGASLQGSAGEEPSPVIASVPGDGAFSDDWHAGYDAYFSGTPFRPMPREYRGAENAGRAQQYRAGYEAGQSEGDHNAD